MPRHPNSENVENFLILFRKLRSRISDTPQSLAQQTTNDDGLRKLCFEVSLAAAFLGIAERQQRELYAAPVNAAFIEDWRSYEKNYQSVLAGIFLGSLGFDDGASETQKPDDFHTIWDALDTDAKEQASAVESVFNFAAEELDNDFRTLPENYAEELTDGIEVWKRTKIETGFQLRDVLRRRDLIPFTLVPKSVSDKYGSGEKFTLFTILQQAQEAFVFGADFASLALVRATLEAVLKRHYETEGADLRAHIDNAKGLPTSVTKSDLHEVRRMTNDVLHYNTDVDRLPSPPQREKYLIKSFGLLRDLIENTLSKR